MKNRLVKIIVIALVFIGATYSEVAAQSTASIAVTVTVEHIEQVAGVRIRVYPRFIRVSPGQIVDLSVEIRNEGNGDDYFKLTATSYLGWRVEFPQGDIVGPLAPGGTKTLPVKVIVPLDARRRQRDKVTITATSQFDTRVFDQGSAALEVR